MELDLSELEQLREERKRWEAYRAEMADVEQRMARLSANFLMLGAYEDAAKCAFKADSMKRLIGRMPPPATATPKGSD